jgi:tetratricopeptide (TPR) repeat protein
VKASKAGAQYKTGLRHMQEGRYLDAQACCREALAQDPRHADALHLMGLLAAQAEQLDQAVEWIANAIRLEPKPEYLSSLGTTLLRQGRYEEALKVFDKAVQLGPENADLWIALGNILADGKRFAEALQTFQHVLTLNPRHGDATFKSGYLLHKLERFDEALIYLDLAGKLQPNNAQILRTRGWLLRDLGRLSEALADNQRVHELDPSDGSTCNDIALIFQALGQEEKALPWFDQALELLPNNMEVLSNKVFLLGKLQRIDEAFALHERMKALGLNNATTETNVSLLRLLTGNFEVGWAGREARWTKAQKVSYPKFSQSMWLGGEEIRGKTLLIHVDEGLGDTIQFVRYIPSLAALGARIILVVERPLHALLSKFPGVSQCLALSAGELPAFDMHCPITNLPLAFGTRLDTIPAETSYLPLPSAEQTQVWEERLGSHDRLRVGLVWSGNPKHKNDHNRSVPLQTFTGLLDQTDATFVSLQKDPRPADKSVLFERTDIVDLTAHLNDFVDTASLVSCLDLVITVDTSVAHLAAALGGPTWVLLPYTPDWRWLLNRDDSPWYPTMRLFRQSENRDWSEVLARVRSELLGLVSAR